MRTARVIAASNRAAAGVYEDRTGPVIVSWLRERGYDVPEPRVVGDGEPVGEALREAVDDGASVVITTGGTGVTGRDVTPEALEQVAEKRIAGFGELFRMLSYPKVGTSTIQSRADAGVAGGTYIFCLPGSPGACRDGWDDILVHQLDIRHKPCNFAELIPRLRER